MHWWVRQVTATSQIQGQPVPRCIAKTQHSAQHATGLPCVCHTACCTQMNVWMAIFGFIGNYFWTHYFFNLLGAAYTLPSHKLNGVSLGQLHGWVALHTGKPSTIEMKGGGGRNLSAITQAMLTATRSCTSG